MVTKAAEVIAHIDATVRNKLLKRTREHGLTTEAGIALAEAWKRAAKHTRHLPGHDRDKRRDARAANIQ
jgi:hypothetical protein